MAREWTAPTGVAVAAAAYAPALVVGLLVGHPLPVAALVVGALVAVYLAVEGQDRALALPAFAAAAGWMLGVWGVTHLVPRWFVQPASAMVDVCRTIGDAWRWKLDPGAVPCDTTLLYDLLFWSAPVVGAVLATVLVLRVVIPRRWAA